VGIFTIFRTDYSYNHSDGYLPELERSKWQSGRLH